MCRGKFLKKLVLCISFNVIYRCASFCNRVLQSCQQINLVNQIFISLVCFILINKGCATLSSIDSVQYFKCNPNSSISEVINGLKILGYVKKIQKLMEF